MKLLVILMFISASLTSFGQSKSDLIAESQQKDKVHLRTIDSLKLVNQSTNAKLKAEQNTSKDQLAQVTKMNFETADLRMVMYKHVASIDSVTRLLDAKTRDYENLNKKYLKCEADKRTQSQPAVEETGERDLITDVDYTKFNVSSASSFKFNLSVNSAGAVLDVILVAKKSTDSTVLAKVKEEIQKQVRYRPSTGAPLITISYSCTIEVK